MAAPVIALPPAPPRVLCVDDDANVLAALHRQLRGRYDVVLARGSTAALERLRDAGPFAVILADLHMPGLNGRALLAAARDLAPTAVGLLLTGGDDDGAAGPDDPVFGRLDKPCVPQILWETLDAAVTHHAGLTGT